jgi:hypothetical protein
MIIKGVTLDLAGSVKIFRASAIVSVLDQKS